MSLQEEMSPDQLGERWKPVLGFEGAYEVSDFGRVRSCDRQAVYVRIVDGQPQKATRLRRGTLLRPGTVKSGHQLVSLGRGASRLVHRLVLDAFVGPKPPGHEGCHGDGNPANNRLDNLRWGTRSDNVQDAVRHGTHGTWTKKLARSPRAMLNPDTVIQIKRRLSTGASCAEIAPEFGVTRSAIYRIREGHNWADVRDGGAQ